MRRVVQKSPPDRYGTRGADEIDWKIQLALPKAILNHRRVRCDSVDRSDQGGQGKRSGDRNGKRDGGTEGFGDIEIGVDRIC